MPPARPLAPLGLACLFACQPAAPAARECPSGPAPPPQPATRPAPAPAPPRPERFDVAAIDAYVADQIDRKGFVGLSLALVRDGELVLARGYGKASLAADLPVDADTAFAIGSVTKQFTCAAALLLAEDGRLSLQDRVSRHYPDLTRAADITLDHLLSHTAGYPDYYPLDFVDDRMSRPIDPDELIRRHATLPLDFEPGTRYSYSNTGFVIAGRVVEKLSGQPLAEFLRERLFTPAGMRHAAFSPPADAPGLATGYTTFSLGPPIPATPEAPHWTHAAGAITASAPDLARWDLALMQGTIFKNPDTLRRMVTPRTLTGGEPIDYACGLAVSRRQGETVVAHSGSVSGFLAYNAMIPRTRSAVVLLANADFVDAGALHAELLALLIDADKKIPTVTGPAPREVALTLVRQYQSGAVDRALLGDAFSQFLSDARLREAAPRLAALGEPTSVVVERLGERGGMEVASLRVTFATQTARALLYRTPDGKVQEFLLLRD
jgi:D-alanyl-D-alanine carboxypeptidase